MLLFLTLLTSPARAIMVAGFTCDAPSVVTTVGGCLTANPELEFLVLFEDGTTSWVDAVVYDPTDGDLLDPGWADAAQWYLDPDAGAWPTTSTTVAHTASSGEDFFAFEFQIDSGERIYLAGPHLFDLDGTVTALQADEALKVQCSSAGVLNTTVVPLPSELE